MSYPMLKAMYYVKQKHPNICTCLIVPDLPVNIAKYGKKKGLYNLIASSYNLKKINFFLKCVDKYVLLSEQMKELSDVSEKDFCVIDGLFDENDFKATLINDNTVNDLSYKTIVYTGSLHEEYGICTLIKAFRLIDDSNYRLVIAGAGNALETVLKYCDQDKRIIYKGILNKIEVRNLQCSATVLINPRSNLGIDAKYCFPSKTIEYMLAGRPVIMCKLDGMEDSYNDIIYHLDTHSEHAMMNSIINVCEKPEEELLYMSKKAKIFILREKNNIVQTRKILNLIGYSVEKVV
jgi:glycosyltransferase involved in cell wall biosynthesis